MGTPSLLWVRVGRPRLYAQTARKRPRLDHPGRSLHFHARHTAGAAKVRIDTLEPIESTLGRRQLRFVLAWAELHQAELLETWRRARDGEKLNEIDPLR